jgi:serine/threonine protein kinase
MMVDNDPFGDTKNLSGELGELSAEAPREVESSGLPEHIGRYRIERVLGEGSFGLVYLAYDDELGRSVAVKVPHARLVSHPKDAEAYRAEGRTVANLDHPNIVPVYDVGSTNDFPCFVVSKFIDGIELTTKIKNGHLNYTEATEVLASVAEALHYAHAQGIVHRDMKPGNILIDGRGEPFIVDFGLALREQDAGKAPMSAGTPAYMSPEQARGEGDQIDGRSDIFSLGVVLYELLVGRQPFSADNLLELIEQINGHEPTSLRQYDDSIPEELQRICTKAMSKQASDRYCTAMELADDLRHFRSQTVTAEPAQLLLVDDNTTNLQVLSQILAGQGHRLLVAKNGESAISIARKTCPDLILLDIMMPGIDGFETCRQLKEDPATRDSLVIFLSARGDVSDKVRGLELGAVDYIAKPFQAEEVIARVRTHLKNRSQRRKAARS